MIGGDQFEDGEEIPIKNLQSEGALLIEPWYPWVNSHRWASKVDIDHHFVYEALWRVKVFDVVVVLYSSL